jgi:hypothetical protein
MGTQYYVSTTGSDANNGTTTALAKLTISAGAALAIAGDTVNVLAGSYQGSIYLNSATYADGTSASPITLLSQVKHAARIRALSAPAAGSGNKACFEVRANGWVIDGFEVTGEDGYTGSSVTWNLGGTEWGIGIMLTGTNCTAQNCHVHDLGRSTAVAASGGAGILAEAFYGGSSCHMKYNLVHDIGSTATSNKVHALYVTLNLSDIIGNVCYRGYGGVLLHAWHGASNIKYVNNTLFNANVGILIGEGDSGATAGGIQNSRIFNNIVLDCSYGVLENGTIGTGNLYDHNLVWNCTNPYTLTGSTATNKISASPGFVNYISTGGGDYHLSVGSASINVGIASLSGTSAPTIDIDGVTRPVSATWDLGAYEFVTGVPDSGDGIAGSPKNWRRQQHRRGSYHR